MALSKNIHHWMAVSGLLGLAFFVIANFTQVISGFHILAGCIQIAINIFVCYTWSRGFVHSQGLAKYIAFIGAIVPLIMMGITVTRVLIPALVDSIR